MALLTRQHDLAVSLLMQQDDVENGEELEEPASPGDIYTQLGMGMASMDAPPPAAKRPRFSNGAVQVTDGVL